MIANPTQTRSSSRAASPAVKREEQIEYCIAERLEEVESSLRLVFEAYRQRGLIEANSVGLRVTPYHLLPSTQILLARAGQRVLCTTSLICDSQELGLPMEAIYSEEVGLRRQAGLCLAEASCLADRADAKTPLKTVLRVMAFTIQCARHRGVDELLAAVHPHHADFYTGFLGFEAFGAVKSCPAVLDHPAVALALDLNRLQEKHPRAYQRAFEPAFPESLLRPRPMCHEIRSYLAFLLEQTGSGQPCHSGSSRREVRVCV